MTIRKGEEWGRKDVVPVSFFIAEDDKDAASQAPNTPFALCRGDLYTALGRPQIPVHHRECTILPIDCLECIIHFTNGQEETVCAVSHVAVGSWWKGRHLVASNSGFLNGLNIAPRSHPNDGEFDLFTMSPQMALRQRFLARQKAKTGTHIPHPDISVSRKTSLEIIRQRPQERLSIDGIAVGNWSRINIEITPDYWEVIV